MLLLGWILMCRVLGMVAATASRAPNPPPQKDPRGRRCPQAWACALGGEQLCGLSLQVGCRSLWGLKLQGRFTPALPALASRLGSQAGDRGRTRSFLALGSGQQQPEQQQLQAMSISSRTVPAGEDGSLNPAWSSMPLTTAHWPGAPLHLS